MNLKHTIIAGLLLTGMSLFAGGSKFVLEGNKSDFFKTKPGLNFHQKADSKQPQSFAKSSFSGKEWDEAEVSGGGLFLNFGIHLPSRYFLNPYYSTGDPKYKLGFDFEFGNYFRFAKIQDGKMGVGLRVTWLSLSYAKMVDVNDIYRVVQISALRVGPQFGYAITEDMGADVYYQWGYNFTDQFGDIYSPGQAKNVGENTVFTGGSHEVGAAFHFRVFSIGFGYRFGNLTLRSYVYDGKEADSFAYTFLQDRKYSVNNFRITLGFKF
ncbi:MAG: hypothetical protein JNL60_11940 [Bacteroidia bacterium]|nr:hypothetical protein [Bacteroidia bacterium]